MNKTHTNLPKWLIDLQQRSWEPEIILSGIVLYGLFQLPEKLDQFLLYFKSNVFGLTTDIDILVSIAKISIYFLVTGLITHLIGRGVWAGLLGLSYIFPEGINHDRLRLRPRFHRKVKNIPATDQMIVRMEKVCSSIFSITFLIFMSIVGGYLFFVFLALLPGYVFLALADFNYNLPLFNILRLYALLILILGSIGLIDFLTLGYLKKYKWFEKIYWPFYQVISFFSLARFYRGVYYNVVSNYNRWGIFGLLLAFVFITFFYIEVSKGSNTVYDTGTFSNVSLWDARNGSFNYSGFYDDQTRQGASCFGATIQSDIIDEDVIRLFVLVNVSLEDSIKANANLDEAIQANPDTARSQLYLHAIQSFYQVSINDSLMSNQEWLFHYNKQTNQRGYLTYLDIADLPRGTHKISIRSSGKGGWRAFTIPFYRE